MTQDINTLFLDISGVLYDGDRVIPGATEAVKRFRGLNLTLRFVTNTASQTSEQILNKLQQLGFDLSPSELITAPTAAKQYLQEKALRPYCLIHPQLKAEFTDLDQTEPNAVLLGDARDGLSYEALNQAFSLCKAGCPLIGIGMNKYFREGETLKLDAGMFIKGIEWAASSPAIIMGKPSRAFFEQVIASCHCSAEQCLMVGDDVGSDVLGAIDAGLHACLVRTGKYQDGDEDALPEHAWVIDSISDLAGKLA